MAGMSTIAQSAAKFRQKIRALEEIPHRAILDVDKVLEARVPVYTGTYEEAITLAFERTPNLISARVFVDHETLLRSAAGNLPAADDKRTKSLNAEFYVTAEASPKKAQDRFDLIPGHELYIQRIEEIGSPIYDKGEGMWGDARRMAKEIVDSEMRRIIQ